MRVSVRATVCVCVSFIVPLLVTCHKEFQTRIPNGDKVPHPCKAGRTWYGVGHELVAGAGANNKFGADFQIAGQKWTRELCEKDSDGDGLTNGEELGDPDCRWQPGYLPEIVDVKHLSHPGIYTCTNWDSPQCQKETGDVEWISSECQDSSFTCPAMEEEGVMTKDIHLPLMQVPRKTTTYVCMDYVVESDVPVHMVATTPIIREARVVHHMLLFGCEPDEGENYIHQPGQPYECGMLPACRGSIISMWSYGMDGDCATENVGFRLGGKGFKRLSLQVHWNNRFHNADMKDASGLKLYLTKNLRAHDAGVWVVGSVHLDIPPNQTSYVSKATCAPKCTENYMSGSIYVTGLLNHMHYLGQSMKVEIIRKGVKHLVVGDVDYNYDRPNFHVFERPFEVRPGDELRTTCEYNSIGKNETTSWGEGSSDEMCFAFVTYFPDQHVRESLCYSWDMVPHCYKELDIPYEGCDIADFMKHGTNGWMGGVMKKLKENCDIKTCRDTTCLPLIYDLRSKPCLRGQVYNFLRHNVGESMDLFHQLYTSCDTYVHKPTPAPPSTANTCRQSIVSYIVAFITLFVIIIYL